MSFDSRTSPAAVPLPEQPTAISGEGMVRVGGISLIPGLLESFGCDPRTVFGKETLELEQVSDINGTVCFSAASRLLARCVEASGCDHFGLELGRRITPFHLGVAGFVVVTASDVATALQSLAKWMDLHDRAGAPTMQASETSLVLGYAIYASDVAVPGHIYDMTMAFACNMLRQLCGEDWAPSEVLLTRQTPRDLAPYRKHFRAPIRFNSEQSGIVIPTHWLEHQTKLANPPMHAYLQDLAQSSQDESDRTLVGQLHNILRQCLALQDVSQSIVARQLGMHPRTLNRRLQSEGTTFRAELDAIKKGMSEQLLVLTNMNIGQVAMALGYGSNSAFNHAFSRWHGHTPRQWRVNQGST